MKKRILALLLMFALLFGVTACGEGESGGDADGRSNDVVVLFTNDVHCALDENLGYAGLAAYKKEMEKKHRYVLLVDCGDFSQGAYEGAVSKGEYPVDLMNAVGYDYAIFGNHEFDYGADQLKKNVARSEAQFLNANVTYTGSGENWIDKMTKPYEIVTCGKVKVAFIGVSTPKTIANSSAFRFMEDGTVVYDFGADGTGERLYDTVQKNVDECRKQGADFVVILSHLGTDVDVDTPYTSLDLIGNTEGIDVVLDAHSHTEAACWIRKNEAGEDVLLSSTGTGLANVGKLVLTEGGTASVGYIDSYDGRDEAILEKVAEIKGAFAVMKTSTIGHLDFDLSCTDADGVRMVRSREVALGDFVADAYRVIGGADIGMCNGGGIRADLKSGDLTLIDVINVNPFGNALCVVKVTGQEIVDMLEYFYRAVKADYKDDKGAIGEDGSFQQVSGIRFTVNTAVPSPAKADDDDAFTGIEGERRVSDVMVLKDGVYVPIDLSATYTLASHDYMIKQGGSGMLYHLADHELVIDSSVSDYQVLIDYMNSLGGDLSQYRTVDERITIQ